jgi:nicotinamidase-related amidase
MWQPHEYHFSFSFRSSGGHPYFIPLLGFGAGLGLFANGFWNYRKLRVIEDTPRIPVRSIPMGLVHVRGKVTGSFLLTSPVTRTPCYYYRVRLERWEERGKSRGWAIVHTETDQRIFYADDGTGKVLINPQSAEYDLPPTYWAEIGSEARGGPYLDPSLGLAAGPSEQELRAYAAKADPRFPGDQKVMAQIEAKYAHATGLTKRIVEREKQALEAENPLTGHGSYRITEHCLVAEHEYDLTGTCAQNPQPKDDDDRNLILKGQNEPTFLISGFSERTLEKTLRKKAVTRIILGGLLMVFMMAILIGNLVES